MLSKENLLYFKMFQKNGVKELVIKHPEVISIIQALRDEKKKKKLDFFLLKL